MKSTYHTTTKLNELIIQAGFTPEQIGEDHRQVIMDSLESKIPEYLILRMIHPQNSLAKLGLFAIKDYSDGFDPSLYLDYRIDLKAAANIATAIRGQDLNRAKLLNNFYLEIAPKLPPEVNNKIVSGISLYNLGENEIKHIVEQNLNAEQTQQFMQHKLVQRNEYELS